MNTTATLIVIYLFIIGCSHYQISKKGISIPNKPGKYPKVTEENLLRGELTPYRTCYDVSFYDLDIKLDIEEKLIETVKYTQEPLPVLTLCRLIYLKTWKYFRYR